MKGEKKVGKILKIIYILLIIFGVITTLTSISDIIVTKEIQFNLFTALFSLIVGIVGLIK